MEHAIREDVAAFEIDLHEVTNEQYGLCVKAERCTAPIESGGVARSAGPRTPVVSVNALQAWDFCAWLGRRLPSDAEWERAARGPDGDLWPRGTRPPARAVNVNRARPVAVDDPRFRAGRTEEGLTHMAGNASEWTATPDRCAPDPYACRRVWDGSRRATLIIRGRGFEEAADRLDGSDADISGSGEEWAYVGFRCARTR